MTDMRKAAEAMRHASRSQHGGSQNVLSALCRHRWPRRQLWKVAIVTAAAATPSRCYKIGL
jgi:hypothetical protein